MRVLNNEMIVHRNETFTIDKIILARDGAPFVVSSQIDNPYICITVTSSKYEQLGRYHVTWWLDVGQGYTDDGTLITLPRFNSTTPMHLTTDTWLTSLPIDPVTGLVYNAFEAIWYINKSDGTKEYKRWDLNTGRWIDYSFRIIKTFTQEDTKEWIEQDYQYDITLVAGDTLTEYLYDLKLHTFMELYEVLDSAIFLDYLDSDYDSALAELWEDLATDNTGIYDWLKTINRNLVKDLDMTAPLINYSAVQIILPPTKLTVQSYLKGGL